MADVLDLTKLVRRKRAACPHDYKRKRSGVERCEVCGDRFPCASNNCLHLDCIERAMELGLREFPTDYPYTIRVIDMRGPLEVVVIDTTDDDPTEWVTP